MKRDYLPVYRLEAWEAPSERFPEGNYWVQAWRGKASEKRLCEKVASYEASTQPGGVNAHVGPRKVCRAQLVRQQTGAVVARALFF
jgi:hypothetical protein